MKVSELKLLLEGIDDSAIIRDEEDNMLNLVEIIKSCNIYTTKTEVKLIFE